VTSRPEAWRTIKYGIGLAEEYYFQEEGQEGLGVKLEPFTYSQELMPFEQVELPIVYKKYQTVFNTSLKK